MAIAASGAVSFSDLRTEFVGGSSAVSFSDLYRGGSNIRAKAGNNTSTNLAASVPASGTINFTNFRSTAKGFRKTYSSGATNQHGSNIFGSDYGVNYPKEIVINSGVEIGATGVGEEAVRINSGLVGSMTVTNNGIISGAGGSANGGAGGDAFEANVACILINNGTIRAGGGGGGAGGSGGSGGTGGGGSYTTTSTGNATGATYTNHGTIHVHYAPSNATAAYKIAGTAEVWRDSAGSWAPWVSQSNDLAVVGGERTMWNAYWNTQYITFGWRVTNTSTTNTNGGGGGSGGGGGAGGQGQGYGVSAAGGSSGSGGSGGAGGGTNAGSGGTGGTGGTGASGGGYGASGGNGNSGATGNSGANGNRTGGSGGSGGSGGASGGAAGKYIRGLSLVTLSQNGTVLGGTA